MTLALPIFAALLAAASSVTTAGTCPDDNLEDNDSCQTALAIAPGSLTGLVVDVDDYDYFKVNVPHGERLVATITSDTDLVFSLFDGATPGNCEIGDSIQAQWIGALTPATLQWANLSGAARDYVIGVTNPIDCGSYGLGVSVIPDACAAIADTGITGNVDCASAATVGAGSFPGQFVSTGGSDFYRVVVQPAELITVDLVHSFAQFSPKVRSQLAASCSPPAGSQAFGVFMADRYRMFLFNETTQVQVYFVEVSLWPEVEEPDGFCSAYDLELSSEFDPAGVYTGDAFEQNDSCTQLAPIDDGIHHLNASVPDQDWFEVTVEPGATLNYVHTPDHGPAWASHLRLDCSNGPGSFLASAEPPTFGGSVAELSWTNTTGNVVVANFFVVHPAFLGEFAMEYTLDLRNTQGEVFCTSGTNSSGQAARIDSSGSTDVNSGFLDLLATGVPANSFGLFFFSPTETAPSPLGNGELCLAGPYTRLPVTNSGPAGLLGTTINWANPGTAGVITPGSTWSFQAWFRDAAGGGAQYDLSDGLRIEF